MRIKQINKTVIMTLAALVVTLVIAPTLVKAEESTETTEPGRVTTSETTEATPENNKSTKSDRREERKEIARARLSAVKLKVCRLHETQVNAIMDRVVARSQGHIDRITTIADRTKAFYEKQGESLDTYATLVGSVETARQAAQAAVNTLSSDAGFLCSSDGPKSDIQEFRNQRLTKITAVGAYRDAVKALIIGVKSAQVAEAGEVKQ